MIETVKRRIKKGSFANMGNMDLLKMDELQPLQKRVLVEKHLISPHLAEDSQMVLVYYQKMKKLVL